MKNQWGDKEVAESAALLFDPLKEANLNAVTEFGRGTDPGEILGNLLRVVKKRYPNEYQLAFKQAVNPRQAMCKECEGPRVGHGARGYCNTCYHRHWRAGDFG